MIHVYHDETVRNGKAMPDTEQEMFESALSEEAPAIVQEQPEAQPEKVEAQPEAQPKSDEKPRDEKGRFAPKTEKAPEVTAITQEPPPVEKSEDKPERGEIPAWRLREEADAKREWQGKAEQAERRAQEIERQFAATQQQLNAIQRQFAEKQNPPPDMYADPEGFQRYQTQAFQQQLRQRDVATSEMLARIKFGDELFDKAEKALESHVRLNPNDPFIQTLVAAPQPAFELVKWFRQQEMQSRLNGKSLEDLLKEEREKALSDPAFLAQAIEKAKAAATPVHPQANSNIPSLNRATASVTQNADDDDSDASLFKRTLRS